MTTPNILANPSVQIQNVQKWFGHTVALQGVSLTVQPGEFVVFLGRNGAGKSTLLRVLARIVKPNSGSVQVCGIDVLKNPELIRSRLGFVAHSSFLYRHLTAFENLLFFARLYQVPHPENRVQETLRWVGLEKQAKRQIGGFSRGMQQRLAIARAVLHNPEILLLDEPFTGLDLEAAELLGQWLKNFVESQKTVIMATHDLEQGLEGAGRWAIVDHGKIMEEMTERLVSVREKYKRFLRERQREIS
jgi:heme exporter protein A